MSKTTSSASKIIYCNDCINQGHCEHDRKNCPLVGPSESQQIMDTIIPELIASVIPAKTEKWEFSELVIDRSDEKSNLEEYYVRFINECLRVIRAARVAYVYKIEHIKDILRFIPTVQVKYRDGVYYVHQ